MVAVTDEFETWYGALDAEQQERIDFVVGLLEQVGPTLSRPYADTIRDSEYPNMKELRVQSQGNPMRIFFAFDPRRTAILLIGGDKTDDNRFYREMVRRADALYAAHLDELEE